MRVTDWRARVFTVRRTLQERGGLLLLRLVAERDLGETRIQGQGLLDQPAWKWPVR